ncbi:nucleotidyltransferase family protein [Alteromonas alba]|jgi:hypothetical protein|nr:nucleotidyltransferase family protein [Alteromonas alba]|tara:strand:- start:24297 stop:25421 length:1125 start_codon:yes stop_codon:yes gene_type:complete
MAHKFSFEDLVQAINSPEQLTHRSLQEWESMLFVLKTSRLEAYLAFVLRDSGTWDSIPGQVQAHLSAAMVYAQRQNDQVFHEGQEIHDVLMAQGVTPVFLKGAAYIVAATNNAPGRLCSDIDLLVKEGALATSETVLLDNFWYHKIITDYDDKYYREYAHEIPPLYHLTRGTVLDLHHNLFLPVSGKAPPLEEFWLGVRRQECGLYTLEPAAMFMHSIIHLMLNEEVVYGFRDIVDLKCLAQQYDSDAFWLRVEQLAVASHFEKELKVVVTLLNHWFKTTYSIGQPQGMFQRIKVKLLTRTYKYALIPAHPALHSVRSGLARFMVFVRGHSIKMPFTVLVKHFSIKLWLGIHNWLRGDSTADAKPVDLGAAFKR